MCLGRQWRKTGVCSKDMPKYFFHIDGPKPYCDEVGTMLPDDRAAWNEMRRTLRVIEHYLEPGQEWRIKVHSESKPVYSLTVSSRRL